MKKRRKETTLPDYMIKNAKYRWEFLRRNREYIKDWEKLRKSLEKKYGDWDPFDGRMTIEQIKFESRWRITPISPRASYDDLTNPNLKKSGDEKDSYSDETEDYSKDEFGDPFYSPGSAAQLPLDIHRTVYDLIFPEHIFGRALSIVDGWDYEVDDDGLRHMFVKDKVAETGKVTMGVDLRYSKDRLMKDFEHLIDEWKILYKKAYKSLLYNQFCRERNIRAHPLKSNDAEEFNKLYKKKEKEQVQIFNRKYHFDNFDNYLKVYDLRQKGVSWAKIAKELNLNSPQSARNFYKAAYEHIKRGIDLYVK